MSPLIPAPDGYPIKIVRDRTPEVVNASGEPGTLFYGEFPGSKAEHHAWLRRKLIEEAAEYCEGRTLSELCDVLAVIEGLAYLHGTNLDGLVPTMRADVRGGFTEGVMMYGHHPEFDGETAPAEAPAEGERPHCPDDGTCHHECVEHFRGACWRVYNASPLSAAGWGDHWPQEVIHAQRVKLGAGSVRR
jgi:predicted house-cleaning noncanonical NTP pyrophosphatase (MazG superfamily)